VAKIHLRIVSACGKIVAAAKDRMPGDPDSPMAFLNTEAYRATQLVSLEIGAWLNHASWICNDCPVKDARASRSRKKLIIFPEICPRAIGGLV
jgi:hypothetical protein